MLISLSKAAEMFGYSYGGMKQYTSKHYKGSVRTQRVAGVWCIETDDLQPKTMRKPKDVKIQLPKAKSFDDYRKMVARSEARNK